MFFRMMLFFSKTWVPHKMLTPEAYAVVATLSVVISFNDVPNNLHVTSVRDTKSRALCGVSDIVASN